MEHGEQFTFGHTPDLIIKRKTADIDFLKL